MRVEIKITDDNGTSIAIPYNGDATQPQQFRTIPDKPLVQNEEFRTIQMFGWSFQPIIRVELKPR